MEEKGGKKIRESILQTWGMKTTRTIYILQEGVTRCPRAHCKVVIRDRPFIGGCQNYRQNQEKRKCIWGYSNRSVLLQKLVATQIKSNATQRSGRSIADLINFLQSSLANDEDTVYQNIIDARIRPINARKRNLMYLSMKIIIGSQSREFQK